MDINQNEDPEKTISENSTTRGIAENTRSGFGAEGGRQERLLSPDTGAITSPPFLDNDFNDEEQIRAVGEKPAARKKTIVKLAVTAMFAALISAGAFVAFPIGPVPIALQNFFTLLSGMVLGPVLGTASVALFIAAGAVGLPVFANNGSPMGMARILGPSGGYLAGYLLGALAAGLIMGFPRAGKTVPVWRIIIAVTAGVLVVYIPGMLRLKMFLNADWGKTLAAGLYPFIAGDIAKGVLAGVIAPRLRRVAGDLFSA